MTLPKILLLLVFALVVVLCIANPTEQQQQIKFTPITLEGVIVDVQHLTKQVVVVLTDEALYLSTDGGINFQNQNLYLCGEKKCVSRMVLSTADANTLVLIGSGEEHYVSNDLTHRDSSSRYHKFKFPISAQVDKGLTILAHPVYKKYFMALVNVSDNKKKQLNNLYISRDGCRSWSMMKDGIRQAVWANQKATHYDPDKILAVKSVAVADYTALFNFNVVTGATSDDLVTGAHDVFHLGTYTFLSTRVESGMGYDLYVSTDNGAQFRKAQLPDKEAYKKAYVLLDNSEGSVFLNVVDKDGSTGLSSSGTVYISDWSGTRYSHSLLHNYVTHPSMGQNKADFHKIQTMEGVYISNVVANPDEENCAKCTADCHKKCKISSRITFNRGALWERLVAPSVGIDGKSSCKKAGKCALHLRGIEVAATSPIHSDDGAVGLILATGNTGERLASKTANTYLSRDAGVSWTEIAKGSHTYEVTDNGALIVMAKNVEPTKNITYSWNSGIDWESIAFTSESEITIEKITYNKNDPLTKVVLLQGSQAESSVLIAADFSGVTIRDCVGYDKPGVADSDYENFIPHTYQNDQCLLGRIVQYVRRKKDAKCFNKHPDKAEKIRNCQCTQEDYECDYYYVRKFNGDKMECVPSDAPEAKDQIEKLKFPPHRCYGYYNETRGYRKVSGNSCQDGVDLAPIPKQCPSSVSSLGVFILFVFFAVLFGFAGLFFYRNSPKFQSMIRSASRYTSQSVVQYSQISQHEEFGLDDTEDDDEPDEFDSTFNFSAVASVRRSPVPARDEDSEENSIDQSSTRTVSLDADPLANRRL